MLHLDYRDPRPIYSQIIDRFRSQILAGVLLPGEKLPSVRELAQELSINPNTIQRAYRQLEMEGWIATVPGKGCFVSGSGAALEQEKQRLLEQLEAAVRELENLGMTRREIADYLTKECESNA